MITRRPRCRFGLLLEAPDGSCLLRLVLPRWALLAGAVLLAVLVIGTGAVLCRDHRSLRDERARLGEALPRLAEQQALLDGYRTRARELAGEISRWREVHARILDPFGPDAGLAPRDAGMGGSVVGASESEPEGADAATDELTRLANVVQHESDELRTLEQFLSRAGKLLAALPSRWPIRGSINSDFGRRLSPWSTGAEFHAGIDIAAAIGTPVRSPAPGTVVFAGPLPEFGIAVVLDHGNDTKSVYGHLSRVAVAADQKVQRGDLIAFTGNTGRSSGPHLHYEIQVAGQPVNPHTYLWE